MTISYILQIQPTKYRKAKILHFLWLQIIEFLFFRLSNEFLDFLIFYNIQYIQIIEQDQKVGCFSDD